MTTLLFPTRGGKVSYANQDQVIGWAKENEARLLFMYVADVRFLNVMARPAIADLEESLEEMGAFMLAMAQERAASQGVEAEIVVCHGVFRKALTEVVRREKVDVVAIGAPMENTGITTPQYWTDMISELIEETGVQVLILDRGIVISHYHIDNLPDAA